jgi:hypothetical protein
MNRQFAHTATTATIPTPVRLTAITVLTGSTEASSLELAHGSMARPGWETGAGRMVGIMAGMAVAVGVIVAGAIVAGAVAVAGVIAAVTQDGDTSLVAMPVVDCRGTRFVVAKVSTALVGSMAAAVSAAVMDSTAAGSTAAEDSTAEAGSIAVAASMVVAGPMAAVDVGKNQSWGRGRNRQLRLPVLC